MSIGSEAICSVMINIRSYYQPQLDGLRAVCIMFTFLNHIHGAPSWVNGSVGVDIFFALSGFLITSLMSIEYSENGSISLRNFYIRRLFRIAPMYFLVFFIYALLAVGMSLILREPSKMSDLASSWPWIISFNRELCDVACGHTFFGHAWTIGIEEKFYIFWPLLFLVIGERTRFTMLAVLMLAGVLVALLMPQQMTRGYLGIIFGCTAAQWARYQTKSQFGALPGLILMVIGYCFSTKFGNGYWNLLISLGASWLIVVLLHKPSGNLYKFLSLKWLVWLGKLTYGVYLLHVLVINFVEVAFRKLNYSGPWDWLVVTVVAYAITISVARFLYDVVEQPLIRFGRSLAVFPGQRLSLTVSHK